MVISPGVVLAAAHLVPTAISLLKGFFGGKSPQERAIEKLQEISERGLDPRILERALAVLNARNQMEQSGMLARLAAGGITPSSGLAQEAVGATRRGLGARTGEAASLFNAMSEQAKMQAMQQLAGMPADTSLGDLLGSALQALQAYNQGRQIDDLRKALTNTLPNSQSTTTIDLQTQPRGSLFKQLKPLELTVEPASSPNIGMKLPTQRSLSLISPYRYKQPYYYYGY